MIQKSKSSKIVFGVFVSSLFLVSSFALVDEIDLNSIGNHERSPPLSGGLVDYIRDINVTSDNAEYDIAVDICYTLDAIYTVGNDGLYNNRDIYLKKWDLYGNLMYTKIWGGPGDDAATAIYSDNWGHIWITGKSNSWNTSYNIIAIRFNETSGDVMFNDTWGGPGDDFGADIVYASTVVNLFGSSNSWNDTYNIVTIQYVLGDDYTYFYKNFTWGDSTYDYMAESGSPSGNVVTGYRYTTEGYNEMFAVKLNMANYSNNDWLYSDTLSIDDRGFDIEYYDSSYYVVGSYEIQSTADISIWKLDSSGNLIWSEQIQDGNITYGYDIEVVNGQILTFGTFNSTPIMIAWSLSGDFIDEQSWGNGFPAYPGKMLEYENEDIVYCFYSVNWGESTDYDYELSIFDKDEDEDGLGVLREAFYGSSDNDADSDDDLLLDWDEAVLYHTNLTCNDSDSDLMPDKYEVDHGLSPNNDDAMLDFDGDGVLNIDEYNSGSDPEIDDYAPSITSITNITQIIAGQNATITATFHDPHLSLVGISFKINDVWQNISLPYLDVDEISLELPLSDVAANTKVFFYLFAQDSEGNLVVTEEMVFSIVEEEGGGIDGFSIGYVLISLVGAVSIVKRVIKKRITK